MQYIKPTPALKNLYKAISFVSDDYNLDSGVFLESLKNTSCETDGAYLVDMEVFHHIINYNMKHRAAADKLLHVCLLSMTQDNLNLSNQEMLVEAMNNLQELFLKYLKKRDLVARKSEAQLLILLPDQSREEINYAVERIIGIYRSMSSDSALLVHFQVEEISPPQAEVFVRAEDRLVHVQIGGSLKPEIDDQIIERWQRNLDLISASLNVPSCLIMKPNIDNVCVFLKNLNRDNPYEVGMTEKLGLGLYCETVLGTSKDLTVANALEDQVWQSNADVGMGMISYFGVPVYWPDGLAFGTLCVLDQNNNYYSEENKLLIRKARDAMENDLYFLVERDKLRTNAV